MANKFLAAIFSLSFIFCSGQTTNSIDSSRNSLAFLKNFYIVYITDIAIGPVRSEDSLVKKYCTPKLLKKFAEHSDPEKLNYRDVDPFIKAQDSDTAVLKTLSIITNKKGTNSYSVSYSWTDYYSKKTTRITIHLIVEKKKEGFRIADVW